jgi:hypothetical protein
MCRQCRPIALGFDGKQRVSNGGKCTACIIQHGHVGPGRVVDRVLQIVAGLFARQPAGS